MAEVSPGQYSLTPVKESEKFSGNELSRPSNFFEMYDRVCEADEVNDHRKAKILPLFLTGRALSYYRANLTDEDRRDYEQVKNKIIHYFDTTELRLLLKEKFRDLRRPMTMSLESWFYAVEEAAKDALEEGQAQKEEAVLKFIGGINDINLRAHLLMKESLPKSLEDVYQQSLRFAILVNRCRCKDCAGDCEDNDCRMRRSGSHKYQNQEEEDGNEFGRRSAYNRHESYDNWYRREEQGRCRVRRERSRSRCDYYREDSRERRYRNNYNYRGTGYPETRDQFSNRNACRDKTVGRDRDQQYHQNHRSHLREQTDREESRKDRIDRRWTGDHTGGRYDQEISCYRRRDQRIKGDEDTYRNSGNSNSVSPATSEESDYEESEEESTLSERDVRNYTTTTSQCNISVGENTENNCKAVEANMLEPNQEAQATNGHKENPLRFMTTASTTENKLVQDYSEQDKNKKAKDPLEEDTETREASSVKIGNKIQLGVVNDHQVIKDSLALISSIYCNQRKDNEKGRKRSEERYQHREGHQRQRRQQRRQERKSYRRCQNRERRRNRSQKERKVWRPRISLPWRHVMGQKDPPNRPTRVSTSSTTTTQATEAGDEPDSDENANQIQKEEDTDKAD